MRFHLLASVLLVAPCLSAQAPPVPSEYQTLYSTLSTQITGFNSAVNVGWDENKYRYLDAPQLQVASASEYTELLQPGFQLAVYAQLQELQALGANAITVQIFFPILYQPFYNFIGDPSQYQQFVSFYQQLADNIHGRGMKLVVEASLYVPLAGSTVTNSFQSYIDTLSWDQYMTARAQNALNVAQLIHPDYMSVLTESDSEESVSGQTNLGTPSGVTQLVQTILTTLQNAGVNHVQLGAGVGTWTTNYMQYIQALVALPMNFVDIHIYPTGGSDFTLALTAAEAIRAAGLQPAISECWLMKTSSPSINGLNFSLVYSLDTFSFRAPLDTAFLQAIVNFADAQQLAFISPYWVDYFFAYLDYNTYGSLAPTDVLNDSYTASTNANLVGAFTSTGLTWETMNIPPDTTPPATPAAPVASISANTINLQWTADHDNVGVAGYNLYRGGTLLTTTSLLTYSDTKVVVGEVYTYTLTAFDASGNVSPMSAPTMAGIEGVVCVNNLTGRGNPSGPGGAQVNLTWSAYGNATGYVVQRSSTSGGPYTQIRTTTAPGYRDGDDGLVAGNTYYYVVDPTQGSVEIRQSNETAIAVP